MASKPQVTPEQEVLDRVRRIETRITTLCIGLGIDTPQQKPVFDPGSLGEDATLKLPSMDCSLKQIMAAIPHRFSGRVVLALGHQTVGQLDVPDRT